MIVAEEFMVARPTKGMDAASSKSVTMPTSLHESISEGTQIVYSREKYRDSFELFYQALKMKADPKNKL